MRRSERWGETPHEEHSYRSRGRLIRLQKRCKEKMTMKTETGMQKKRKMADHPHYFILVLLTVFLCSSEVKLAAQVGIAPQK